MTQKQVEESVDENRESHYFVAGLCLEDRKEYGKNDYDDG